MAVGDKLPVVMGREKAVPSGVATLGADGILAEAQRPSASQIMTADGSSVESALTVVGAPTGGIEGQALVSAGAGSTSRVKWGPWPSTPNLLDNWYFVGGGSQQGGGRFPINQRGKTEYTNYGYTIDRWSTYDGITVALDNAGISITPSDVNSNDAFLRQIVENYNAYANLTLTFSIKIESSTGPGVVVRIYDGVTTKTSIACTSGICTISKKISSNPTALQLTIRGATRTSYNTIISAAKLELGDNQTLAHKEGDTWVLNDPPPNYQQEFVKCQMYFRSMHFYEIISARFNNTVIASLNLQPPMRANSTILNPNACSIYSNSGSSMGGTVNQAYTSVFSNIMAIALNVPTGQDAMSYGVTIRTASEPVFISSDL